MLRKLLIIQSFMHKHVQMNGKFVHMARSDLHFKNKYFTLTAVCTDTSQQDRTFWST